MSKKNSSPNVNSTHLLPCPFCGGEAKIVQLEETKQYYPICTNNKKFCLMRRLPIDYEDGFVEKDVAIMMWNQRAR